MKTFGDPGHVEDLPAPYDDAMFKHQYGKFQLLMRKGFQGKFAFPYFYQLHQWPLGLLLTYPDAPGKKPQESLKSLKRKRIHQMEMEQTKRKSLKQD